MSKLFASVGTVVAAVAAFALLCSVGYFTQIGISQSFGPSAAGNTATPPRNKPRSNDFYSNRSSSDDPEPERVKGWNDIPLAELTNESRLKNRPGNFGAVGAVVDFLAGVYQVEPEYRHLSYPLQVDNRFIESAADFEPWIEPDRSGYNRIRNSNVEIENMSVFNLDASLSVDDIPDDMGVSRKESDYVARLRESYSGRLVVVSIKIRTESLTSDDSNSGEGIRFILNRKPGEDWKIIYIVD